MMWRIGHEVISAIWNDGHLTADPNLLDRAELLIQMGETFSTEDMRLEVPAELDTPYAAALTLIRCLDRITRAEIVFPTGGESDSSTSLRAFDPMEL